MGLPVSAALRAVVLERRAGHAGLHSRNDSARPAAGTGDRAGANGADQPGGSLVGTAAILADFTEILGVPAAMAPDRVRRGVSLHTVAGTNRLGVLRAAGCAQRANSGHRRRG